MAITFLKYMENKRTDYKAAINGNLLGLSKLVSKNAPEYKLNAQRVALESAQKKLEWVTHQMDAYQAGVASGEKFNVVMSKLTTMRDSYTSDANNSKSTPAQKYFAQQIIDKLNKIISP